MKVLRRAEMTAAKRARAGVMREWLQDRVAAAQKRAADRRELAATSEPGGHGVTVAMRNIRRPEPEWVVTHEHAPAAQRRKFRTDGGKVRTWPGDLREPGRNVPYVNPARDLKPARRLRKELRGGQPER